MTNSHPEALPPGRRPLSNDEKVTREDLGRCGASARLEPLQGIQGIWPGCNGRQILR